MPQGELLESRDDADVPPIILGEGSYLRIFSQFPYPFLSILGRQKPVEHPRNQVSFSAMFHNDEYSMLQILN